MHTPRLVIAALTVTALFPACGDTRDDGEGDSSSQGGAGAEASTDAAACDTYKRTFCSYGVDCGLLLGTERECLSDIASVTCRSPRLARDCDAALSTSSCVEAPANCDVVNVADTTEARAACEAFSDAVCTLGESCGGLAYDDCRFDFGLSLPCEFTFVVTRDPAECLAAVRASACDTQARPECEDLFILM